MTIENKLKNKAHVGKVIDAHGIKGDIYCFIFSGDASWVSKLKTIYLGGLSFNVQKAKTFKKGFIATLEGITDRNKAEELKGSEVWVDSGLFISEHGEAIYLIELLKFTVNDKTLGEVGQINAFSSNGMQDLLVVSANSKSFEIPFVKDFVISIDNEKKIIYMNLPVGLLEINETEKNE